METKLRRIELVTYLHINFKWHVSFIHWNSGVTNCFIRWFFFSDKDGILKARDAFLISKDMTLEPYGMNRRDET